MQHERLTIPQAGIGAKWVGGGEIVMPALSFCLPGTWSQSC